MDLLEFFVDMLAYWRLTLATLAAIGVAIVLVLLIPSFSGAYAIALVLFGFGVGLLWEYKSPKT